MMNLNEACLLRFLCGSIALDSNSSLIREKNRAANHISEPASAIHVQPKNADPYSTSELIQMAAETLYRPIYQQPPQEDI
jgi:hypothetical protein